MYLHYLKPLIDFLLAAFFLILFAPILFLLGVVLQFHLNEAPVFFQRRIGKDGVPFIIFKFKTINRKRETTTLTKFYRKYKLDELPQLFNVVQGKMSLVGPRPDIPGYYDRLIGEDRSILNLKPGLTGYASLKYFNEEEILNKVDDPRRYNDEVIFPEKVKLNLYYLKNISLWLDMKIIFKTIFLPIMK